MLHRLSHFRSRVALALLCVSAAANAGDAPGTKPKPLGPEVDITLKDATSRRGILLSFANGMITMELDSGDRLVKQSGEVTSLRFMARREIPSAQATALSYAELNDLDKFRLNRANLNKEDIQKLDLLRAKINIHIEAVKREIPDVKTESLANEMLLHLHNSLVLSGLSMPEVSAEIGQATNSIKDPRIVAALKNHPKYQRIQRLIEGFKPFKNPDKKPPFGPPGTQPSRTGDKQ